MKNIIIFYLKTILSLIFCCQLMVAHAQIYVNDTATGTNNGTSWTDAYTDLQAAINAANPNDQIWVAQGTYYPTEIFDTDNNGSNETREATFYINKDIQIYGGLEGTETQLPEPTCDPTTSILCGDIGTLGNNGDNTYHVLYLEYLSSAFILDGFTIQNGNANGGGSNRNGGGIYNNGSGTGNSSNPTIQNCIFENNSARTGGAVYNYGQNGTSSPSFINVSFVSNSAGISGGAVYNNGQRGTSSPSFINVSFISNSAGISGGAVYNYGIVLGGTSNPSFINVSFVNNSAGTSGGAVHNFAVQGISSPNFINASFVSNSAGTGGGAVYSRRLLSGASSPSFTNAIFWGNTATNGNIFYNNNASPSINYSLVDMADCNALIADSGAGTTCGVGMIYNQDPLFINANGNIRLQCTSPAIDAGDNTANSEPTDIDGLPRIINSTIDMGAYEGCIAPGTVLNAGTYAALCETIEVIELTGNPIGDGFTWSGTTGVTDNGDGTATFDPTDLVGQTVMLTYHYADADECLIEPVTTVIIVAENPSVSLENQTICEGETAIFTATTTGGVPTYSYQWQDSNGTTVGTNNNTYSPASTTAGSTYTVIVTDANGCSATSEAATLNIADDLAVTLDCPTILGKCTDPVFNCNPMPTGGTFTGTLLDAYPNAIDATGMIDLSNIPASVPAGQYSIIYTYTDQLGCTGMAECTFTLTAPSKSANAGSFHNE